MPLVILCLERPGVEVRVPIRSIVGGIAFDEDVQVEIVIKGLRMFLDPSPEGIANQMILDICIFVIRRPYGSRSHVLLIIGSSPIPHVSLHLRTTETNETLHGITAEQLYHQC